MNYFYESSVTTHLYEGSMEAKESKQFTDRQVMHLCMGTIINGHEHVLQQFW